MPTEQLQEHRVALVFAEFAALACGDGDEGALQLVLAQRCVELLGVTAAGVAFSDAAGRLLPAVGVAADIGGRRQEGSLADIALAVPSDGTLASAWRSGPVHRMLMMARGHQIGVLTLTGGADSHLDDEMGQIGQALADAAANAVLVLRERRQNEKLADQLQHALTSRVVIEQAVGILAERWHVDVKQAFQLLREHVRSHNLRLRDVAEAVVGRDLDPFPTHQEQPSLPR
jgi:hypothetical protein